MAFLGPTDKQYRQFVKQQADILMDQPGVTRFSPTIRDMKRFAVTWPAALIFGGMTPMSSGQYGKVPPWGRWKDVVRGAQKQLAAPGTPSTTRQQLESLIQRIDERLPTRVGPVTSPPQQPGRAELFETFTKHLPANVTKQDLKRLISGKIDQLTAPARADKPGEYKITEFPKQANPPWAYSALEKFVTSDPKLLSKLKKSGGQIGADKLLGLLKKSEVTQRELDITGVGKTLEELGTEKIYPSTLMQSGLRIAEAVDPLIKQQSNYFPFRGSFGAHLITTPSIKEHRARLYKSHQESLEAKIVEAEKNRDIAWAAGKHGESTYWQDQEDMAHNELAVLLNKLKYTIGAHPWDDLAMLTGGKTDTDKLAWYYTNIRDLHSKEPYVPDPKKQEYQADLDKRLDELAESFIIRDPEMFAKRVPELDDRPLKEQAKALREIWKSARETGTFGELHEQRAGQKYADIAYDLYPTLDPTDVEKRDIDRYVEYSHEFKKEEEVLKLKGKKVGVGYNLIEVQSDIRKWMVTEGHSPWDNTEARHLALQAYLERATNVAEGGRVTHITIPTPQTITSRWQNINPHKAETIYRDTLQYVEKITGKKAEKVRIGSESVTGPERFVNEAWGIEITPDVIQKIRQTPRKIGAADVYREGLFA